MTDRLFRALLTAYMCADSVPPPWPRDVDDDITAELNEEAVRRGYESWVDAYHYFIPGVSV